MNNLPWQIEKIINVANQLQAGGRTGASTGERIAAALYPAMQGSEFTFIFG